MRDDLVERVARGIAAHKRQVALDAPEVDRTWAGYCGQAKAIIPIVMEEAARIADGSAVCTSESAKDYPYDSVDARRYRARANEAEVIAHSIRSRASDIVTTAPKSGKD